MNTPGYMKEYYAKNKERLNAYNRAWRLKNAEKSRAASMKWYYENKDTLTEKQKAARKESIRRWVEKNRESYLAKRRETYHLTKHRKKKEQSQS